jgi:hypothetical protein
MDWFSDPQIWIGLLTLTALEIVLGIDNIVFISILSGRLPASSQRKARANVHRSPDNRVRLPVGDFLRAGNAL